MGLPEIMMARVDRKFAINCQQQVENAMGSGYGVGMNVGRKLVWLLDRSELDNIKPPIFAVDPEQDLGETAGFKAQLGVAPNSPLEDVASVLESRYGLKTTFVRVEDEAELDPTEKTFMSGRLPAVRVCPVLPYISQAAVA